MVVFIECNILKQDRIGCWLECVTTAEHASSVAKMAADSAWSAPSPKQFLIRPLDLSEMNHGYVACTQCSSIAWDVLQWDCATVEKRKASTQIGVLLSRPSHISMKPSQMH